MQPFARMRLSRWAFLFLFVSAMVSGDWAQTKKPPLVGYVYCASDKPEHSVPVFLDPCLRATVGNISCGEKLDVLSQSGEWLKVVNSGGVTRFMKSGGVSQKPDEFVPLDIEAGPAPVCKAPPSSGIHPPSAVFTPEPDYAPSARLAKKEGSVLIGLVVGIDGVPHDVKVVSSLDKDLDAKAIEAVQRWRFKPALKNGEPVEVPIKVNVDFHLYH
ncbi:MAG: energy transducer TonB [Candidatus Sulfotelmatobacter sp.]|jgi:TonB family protein